MQSKQHRRAQAAPRKPEGWRKRFFLLFTIAFPLVFFVLVEITLRIVHYGPDLSVFSTDVLHGKRYFVMNSSVKSRYFAKVDFNPSTSPDYFLAEKPAGMFRIFCLGGSTTVGYPYWFNGSFSSFLRDRLHAIFPDRPLEIVNVGMTATNSFTVLDIARDLVRYQPDLLIVYDGHNEFYGALGVASRESEGRARWLTLAYLRLIHLRTFVLLRDAYSRAASLLSREAPAGDTGTMMERLARGQYVPLGSDTYREGLRTFTENLGDLGSLCRREGIPLILGTQVSSLKDQAPFVSRPGAGTTPAQEEEFRALMLAAQRCRQAGRPDSAAELLGRAAALDTLRADPWYALGRALEALGRNREARGAFVRARDLDQLRFRTSSDFNNAILGAADGGLVSAVDMERVFAGASPDSLIGRELIVEHLHPNSRGYFLLARAYAEAMRQRGLFAPADEWARRDTVSDAALWAARTVTELDERTAQRRTEVLTSSWPFKDQYPIVDAIPRQDTLGQMAELLSRGKWNWLQAHEEAAAYHAGRGDTAEAEREYRTMVDQFPHDLRARLALAHWYLAEGKTGEMKRELTASLAIEKTILACRALGDLARQEGRNEEALAWYGQMDSFPQSPVERFENGYLRALAYAGAGKKDSASAWLLKVLSIKPDFQPAAEMLARLNLPGR